MSLIEKFAFLIGRFCKSLIISQQRYFCVLPMRVTVSEKGLSITESPFFRFYPFQHIDLSSIRHRRIKPFIYQLDKSAFASIFLSTLSGSFEKKS